MPITIATTTPFASVAEADIYFDPDNNHLYAEEWWASDVGSKASWSTLNVASASNIKFEAVDAGVDGNLLSVAVQENDAFVGAVANTNKSFAIFIAEDGSSTVADVLAVLSGTDTGAVAFRLVMTASAVSGTSGVFPAFDYTYLWGGVDPDPSRLGQKLPALAFATRKMNNLPWNGMKVSPTQTNAFPRKYKKRDGTYYEQTEVPELVRAACCEEALAILKYGNTTRYKLQAQGVSGYGFGNQGLRESFVGSKEGDLLSGECMNMIRGFLKRNWVMGA